jgi:hypothetical protein
MNPNSTTQTELHPLYRLAIEAPEQLEPVLRRAAMKMARKRLFGWIGETLRRAVSVLEESGRQGAARY